MDLHKENVPALRFLAETVNIFSAQAKQYDVTVELVLEPEQAPRGRGAGALPLLLSDDFACDRFKLEQVRPHLAVHACLAASCPPDPDCAVGRPCVGRCCATLSQTPSSLVLERAQ